MIARPGDLSAGSHPEGSKSKRYWTVADLLVWTESHFKKLGIATPRLDAELLLANAMGITRMELYTGYRKVVEGEERSRFRALVERRGRYEPVAYILGVREFYSLSLEVNPSVLIPRPETEHLIDRVLEEMKDTGTDKSPRILDLGTGSGNIVIALLVNLKQAHAVAVDVSTQALDVAMLNAKRYNVADRIEFLSGDLFEPLSPCEGEDQAGPSHYSHKFDVIVSNPPYVSPEEYPDLMPDVRDYEPSLALMDKIHNNGLGYYWTIGKRAREFLAPGGLLGFEIGGNHAKKVENFLLEEGWGNIQTFPDYAGIPRVITARLLS